MKTTVWAVLTVLAGFAAVVPRGSVRLHAEWASAAGKW